MKNILLTISVFFALYAQCNATMFATPTHQVNVQVIRVTDESGNGATTFGDKTSEVETAVDNIFSDAGIDVEFLDPVDYELSLTRENFVKSVTSGSVAIGLLNQWAKDVLHDDENVINMFMVDQDVVPNDDAQVSGTVVAKGFASIGNNGIIQYINGNHLDNLDTISKVVSHEIAHNLGLEHTHDSDDHHDGNLMEAGGTGTTLTNDQIGTLRSSSFAVAIPQNQDAVAPEPSTYALFGTAFVILGFIGYRKRHVS